MSNQNVNQKQNYIGIIKKNNVQKSGIGSCVQVLDWIWRNRDCGNQFLLVSPNYTKKQVHPQHFFQKNDFIDEYSNISCLNNTIKEMVMNTSPT